MALNIKSPNYISTSKLDKDNQKQYKNIINKLECSWKIKINDIEKAKKYSKRLKENANIKITPDDLKNLSLITYIDAPWGSGKTYFIEKFIEWISIDKDKLNFSGQDEFKTKELDVNVLDAWEIYNSSNIEEYLIKSFDINWESLKEFLKTKPIKNNSSLLSKVTRTTFISLKKIVSTLNPLLSFGTINLDELFKNQKELKKIWNETWERENLFKDISDIEKFKLLISLYIEDKYKKNNKLIIIDNIERLSSKNRLDVINKVMNWANLSGATYLFLTNFQKININTVAEEDFWNKISLYETFKLENDWQTYIDDYKHEEFDLSKYKKLQDFIKLVIPSFFSSNEDCKDIREIKKLLDNWEQKIFYKNEKDLISSFMKEVQGHINGLDKYFFINKSIGILSEHNEYWDLWKKDLNDETREISNDVYTPLINNKMLRIQSNFYELKVLKSDDKILKFKDEIKFKIRKGETIHFKSFNNFIDDEATDKFKKVINDLFKSRKIEDEDHKLILYLKAIGKDEISYFEFKYNTIRKIHIYNDIFSSN